MRPTREQIIDLINQYIYTNGKQRITAIQLNEILMLIANSFELVGQGTGGGISQVLNTDPNVDDNQKIINKNGGRVELSGMINVNDKISVPYMGLLTGAEGKDPDPRDPNKGYQFGAVVSNQMATVVGNSVGINPFEYLDKQKANSLNSLVNTERERKNEERKIAQQIKQRVEQKEETAGKQKSDSKTDSKVVTPRNEKRPDIETSGALSLYLPDNLSLGDDDGIERGMYSALVHDYAQNIIKIQEDRIKLETVSDEMDPTGVERELETNIKVGIGQIEQEIYLDGTDMNAYERLQMKSKEFLFNWNRTLSIDYSGLRFDSGKRLAYYTDSFSGTAGVATLVSGNVLVNTTAIQANSYVMLTVQNAGEFQGNIRVSQKTVGSGFRISSTNNTDNCQVLWQIIDIN